MTAELLLVLLQVLMAVRPLLRQVPRAVATAGFEEEPRRLLLQLVAAGAVAVHEQSVGGLEAKQTPEVLVRLPSSLV